MLRNKHYATLTSMTDSMLTIRDLVKVYGRGARAVRAVDGISLAIPQGSFYGLLGPNGAGKSTVIGCVTGTHTITSGCVAVNGYDVVSEYRAARRSIGLSAQEFNINPFENVYNLLDFMGGFYGVPHAARRERVEQLLAEFGLTSHAYKSFKELSGGLKRRAVLARALVHDPSFLILDEPTAGIDVAERREVWEYLRTLNAAGKTIILTSHYLEEVQLLCDSVAIINHGRIVARGSTDSYLKNGRTLEEEYLAITQGETY